MGIAGVTHIVVGQQNSETKEKKVDDDRSSGCKIGNIEKKERKKERMKYETFTLGNKESFLL